VNLVSVRPVLKKIVAYLKDDVANIEYRQHCVVVISFQLQVLLQTGETSIANVRSVNEAEQVQ
jgi:hypothetical protein